MTDYRMPMTIAVAVCLGGLAGCAYNPSPTDSSTAPQEPSQSFRSSGRLLDSARKKVEQEVETEQVGGEKLDLRTCIATAVKNNPRLRSTWHAVSTAAARIGEESADYLPDADVSVRAGRSDQASLDNLPARRETGPTTSYETGINLRYLLYTGGRRAANVRGARAGYHAFGFRHNSALQDVALRVEEAYYAALSAKWSLKVARETLKQREHHVELSRERHEAGVVPRSDVLQAETQLGNARLGLVRAKSEVKVARGELARAMGVDVSSPPQLKEKPAETRERELAMVDTLLDEASRNRPTLKAALAEVTGRQAGIEAARAAYRPEVSAQAGYGWRDEHLLPDREEWSATLGVTFPLFTGFERSYRLQRTESELQESLADYREALQDVELEVWTAYTRVREARQAIDAAQKLVASAEENLRVARGEYRSGAGSITELIDAQQAYTEARSQVVVARTDWHTALARLERAVGQSTRKQASNDEKDQ
ncbi:MAG: TolC family protein [Planctomycetota bacterium]